MCRQHPSTSKVATDLALMCYMSCCAFRYVSYSELSTLSSFMVGRLTLDKINAALEELAGMAERNAKLIAATRANRVAAAERKRATVLLHSVSVRMLPCQSAETWLAYHLAAVSWLAACAGHPARRCKLAAWLIVPPRQLAENMR